MLGFFHILYHYTMKDTMDWLAEAAQTPWKSTVAALIFSGVYLLRALRPQSKRKRTVTTQHKEGVAYIHMFPRNFTKKVINLSPYAIKVETWCRMNKVPYEVVETSQFSSKEGQIPWMMLNGQETADSGAIINVLRDHFHVRASPLSEAQRGVERAVSRMMDDSFAVLYFWYRYYVEHEEFSKYFSVTTAPKILRAYIQKQIGKGLNKRAHYMGFSRYGTDHVIQLGKSDLEAVEGLLGEHNYLLGDSPTELDATVFGHLTQVLCPDMPYPWKTFVNESCPKLQAYFSRMKSEFWPDWDSLVSTGTFH